MNEQANRQLDPQIEALLDEALSAESVPGGIPRGLAERIVEKTRDSLPGAHAGVEMTGRRPGVIARIGPARIRAMAAAIVLAASVGVVLLSVLIARDAREIALVNNDVRAIEQYELPADPMSEELALIDMQIQLAMNNGGWSETTSLLNHEVVDLEFGVGTSETGSLF